MPLPLMGEGRVGVVAVGVKWGLGSAVRRGMWGRGRPLQRPLWAWATGGVAGREREGALACSLLLRRGQVRAPPLSTACWRRSAWTRQLQRRTMVLLLMQEVEMDVQEVMGGMLALSMQLAGRRRRRRKGEQWL